MRTIKIYQIKRELSDEELTQILFRDYETVSSRCPNALTTDFNKYYREVYEMSNVPAKANELILSDLWEMFNIDLPDDYEGRSMSVSDVVEIGDKRYYCDSIGWVEL